LVRFLRNPRPELELEDEEDGGGDHKEVGVEGREAEGFECEGEIVCWWCLSELLVGGTKMERSESTIGIVHVRPMR
jgi:hypothetical protein